MPLTAPVSLAETAWTALDHLAPPEDVRGGLGIAVSGGSDSMALLRLAADWAAARGVRLAVATVDHGLRSDAAEEAAFVAARAAALGLSHATLRWRGWDGTGNLQATARDARAALLAEWARAESLDAVAQGHTLDDQAETLLLRLARGSGVDGLSAMAARVERAGATWIRPLLGLRREDLRLWLAARGETWRDDPSNADPRFDRVRARKALDALAPLGIDAAGLAATTDRMRRARRALEHAAAALAAGAARRGLCGEASLDRQALAAAPEEIALRVLADALGAVSGARQRPRATALASVRDVVAAGAPGAARTLHGCVLRVRRATVVISREPAAVREDAAPAEGLWDNRWRVAARGEGVIAALGAQGLAVLQDARRAGAWSPPPGWRDAPWAAQAATPALWRNGALAAAPLAAYGDGLEAVLADDWPRSAR